MTRALGRAAAVFYDVERLGPPVPDGPVLVVANHPNVFLDPLVIFHVAGRPTRPLSKASHFENPAYRPFLLALGGLPVWRPMDDATQTHRNEETFRAAVAALSAGDAVQIYPEGRSHSEPALAPLRTGAARIALRAESESGWRLGLRIVPVGLTYERKTLFRGRAVAAIGEPMGVGQWRPAWETDPIEAARSLTDAIAAGLEAVTLNFAEERDLDLVETAERLYAREKGWAEWREREGLRERLPRLQAFARGLAWLRAHDPERHRRLAAGVRRYRWRMERLGAGAGDVPPRYGVAGVVRWVLREGGVLLVGLPLAALGMAVWWLPSLAPRLVVRLGRPEHPAIATWKLIAGLLAFGAWYAGIVAATAWTAGPAWAPAVAVALPLLGVLALAWAGRWARVREDIRLFSRVVGAPRHRDRLAADRARLAREFDAVLGEIARTEGDRGAAQS
ncbi:MAG TPA: 1-acyl-sn-glycerol-3-phosphate acyltransferase [Gemmatimonadota bacterium]|nr:1-acyl-sn-glycerol-3-phosphate acyltransferase [Gemmatimonadota bacterium]